MTKVIPEIYTFESNDETTEISMLKGFPRDTSPEYLPGKVYAEPALQPRLLWRKNIASPPLLQVVACKSVLNIKFANRNSHF